LFIAITKDIHQETNVQLAIQDETIVQQQKETETEFASDFDSTIYPWQDIPYVTATTLDMSSSKRMQKLIPGGSEPEHVLARELVLLYPEACFAAGYLAEYLMFHSKKFTNLKQVLAPGFVVVCYGTSPSIFVCNANDALYLMYAPMPEDVTEMWLYSQLGLLASIREKGSIFPFAVEDPRGKSFDFFQPNIFTWLMRVMMFGHNAETFARVKDDRQKKEQLKKDVLDLVTSTKILDHPKSIYLALASTGQNKTSMTMSRIKSYTAEPLAQITQAKPMEEDNSSPPQNATP
jgi:hypothetical protein